MRKLFYFGVFLFGFIAILSVVYFFTRDFPIYDRFYSPQERSARDIQRIKESLPKKIGEYTLQTLKKTDVIQAYEGCYDEKGQSAVEFANATLCEREIIAEYKDLSTGKQMTVDFLSITKGLDEYMSRTSPSFNQSDLNGQEVYRFKKETDNEVLWYPAEKRNPILESLGWYPAVPLTSISIQQVKITPLPDRGENHDYTGVIDIPNPVVAYFLEKYPSKE